MKKIGSFQVPTPWTFINSAHSSSSCYTRFCHHSQPKQKQKQKISANMAVQTSRPPNFPSFLIFILCLQPFCSATSKAASFLPSGSSLSVEDDGDVLTSPDKTFSCGFYGSGGNAYWFSIWYSNSKDRTVIWTANRDRLVNGKGSRVTLRRNGILVLTDVDGTVIWSTNTSSTDATMVELLDSGNLVLKDPAGHVLWQSFDFPTDTLLPNQPFTKSSKLVSRLGRGSYGSGYFSLLFDNNNVLSLKYDGPDTSSLYWPVDNIYAYGRTNYNSSRVAGFDDMGNFASSDQLQFSASDTGLSVKRRLTLDIDGNMRLYSLNNATGLWSITWQALLKQCDVHGICGQNAICVNTPEPKCSCPPGYEILDPGNWNKGCKKIFNETTCSQSLQQVKFVKVPYVDYYGYDLNSTQTVTREECMKLCLGDCRCQAFSYRMGGDGRCFTKSSLFNGFMSPNFPGDIYLKFPVTLEISEDFSLNGSDIVCSPQDSVTMSGSLSVYATGGKKVKWVYLYSFAGAIGGIEIFFTAIVWLLFGRHGLLETLEAGYLAISSNFRKFSYSELKKVTKNFKEELGRGASGAVYKGVLEDGRVVAVKRLEDSFQGEDVFWAEVNTIGKINHMNLVRMWGFCSDKKHRLLVYEFMKHQSLDKHLFSSDSLTWKDRFMVALGTAKGLAYLHMECLEWVIHCDVKPENILLDSEFEPKIADFGLAKLSRRGSQSSEFSRIRGTKGYMAPEWALNHPITAKVDVYSYGVVILELVKGIRLSNWIVKEGQDQESELTRFVREVKVKIESTDETSWLDEVVDPKLEGQFDRKQATTMVQLGISCVKEDRNLRPSMDSVVQSLLDCQG